MGLEPYCEALSSEIIHKIDPTSVRYSVLRFHRETATKCKAFTNEDVGFVPLRKLVDRHITLDELLDYFEGLGCREAFQRMLVLDAVTFNVDRHLGNIGVLVDNDTQKILGIAPNFDFNLSMLPYVTKEEFGHIGTKLLDYGPAIGNDFTRVGQEMLTAETRQGLINLQGFQFSFRGNKEFEPWRVNVMEGVVDQQIKAILKGGVLYTKDVFIPDRVEREPALEAVVYDNKADLQAASALALRLGQTHVFSSVMEMIGEDDHVCVIATVHVNEDFIDFTIHMDNMEITCDKNGIETAVEELASANGTIAGAYEYVCRLIDDNG